MSTKMLPSASLKAVGQRTIEFYMLAFSDEPDRQGDMIAPNAADGWLQRFYAAGQPLPVSFTHAAVTDPQDPFNIIGYAPADPQHVFKDDHGIRVRAFLDTETNPTAQQVYTLAQRGIITGASVAYMTTMEGQVNQKDGSILITNIEDILEGGPCLDPANEEAYILAVKSMELAAAMAERVPDEPEPQPEPQPEPLSNALVADIFMKAGRILSASNLSKIRAMRDVCNELLALGEQEVEAPATKAMVNGEEPSEANPEEPGPNDWLRRQLDDALNLEAAPAMTP